MERFKVNKKLFDSGRNVELSYVSSQPHGGGTFSSGLPINMKRLQQLHSKGEYSDISIYIEGQGLIARAHKVILGLYSVPFAKVRSSCFLWIMM